MKVQYLIIEHERVLTGVRKGVEDLHFCEWCSSLNEIMDKWESSYEKETQRKFNFKHSAHTVIYYELVEFIIIETLEDKERAKCWKFPRISALGCYGCKVTIKHSNSFKDYQGNEIKPWEVEL